MNGFANNEYSIVLFGYFVGNMIARNGMYEFFKTRITSKVGFMMMVICLGYVSLQIMSEEDKIGDFTLFNSMTFMFVFSTAFSLPSGSVYSAVIDSILVNKNQAISNNQKEAAINWVLIMSDGGCLFANIVSAWI